MRDSRVSRWFAAGITGTLFAIIMLAMAAPVAADGLVTTIPGQDPNAPIQVVSSPGFVNNGTATNPVNGVAISNGVNYCTNGACNENVICTQNACYPSGTICTTTGCGVPFGGVCYVNGCVTANPICTINGCVTPAYNCTVYGCGTLGVTAAGPIVGVDANGNTIVYDVRGGSYDTYTRDANGRVCEADSRGNCQKT